MCESCANNGNCAICGEGCVYCCPDDKHKTKCCGMRLCDVCTGDDEDRDEHLSLCVGQALDNQVIVEPDDDNVKGAIKDIVEAPGP